MRPVVRAFIFNPEGSILLARHEKDSPWVLPGGHIEANEALHDAMMREIREEFGLKARFFDSDESEMLSHRGRKLPMSPLPIASYNLEYKNKEWKDKSRTEYVFLMETDDEIRTTQHEEIVEYAWFDPEKILTMKPNVEIWDFTIEILERIIGDEELGE